MTIRLYFRRSETDSQEYSVTTQRAGAYRWIATLNLSPDVPIVEYLDDGLAGDDFTRPDLRKMVAEVQPGDLIGARDQSRVGRDAVEVTVTIRELIQRKRGRLFYWFSGQEVRYESALDAATVMIQGVGHQMELEAIRSRTRESLRERVRAGRIAGGRCYGYRLERRRDKDGEHTVAVVDPAQAEIVRRIFREYLAGRGIKAICKALNADGVLGPRGGAWAPTALRPLLLNPRYTGLYTHGRVKRVKRGGRRVAETAAPAEVLRIEIPEWRIIDEDLWEGVAELFAGRATGPRPQNAMRYALSGIGRCSACQGPIAVGRTVLSRAAQRERVPAYGCAHHRERGTCDVATVQPVELVDGRLAAYLRGVVLAPDVVDTFVAAMRDEIRAQSSTSARDVTALEAELSKVQREKARLIRLAAASDDDPDVAAEVANRSRRTRELEAQIGATRRAPALVREAMAKVEAAVRAKLDNLAAALAQEREETRGVFAALFPEGLTFQAKDGGFRIRGAARLDSAVRDVTPPGIEPGIAP